MSDANDGMTAIEVEILLPLVVPNMASLTLYYVYIE